MLYKVPTFSQDHTMGSWVFCWIVSMPFTYEASILRNKLTSPFFLFVEFLHRWIDSFHAWIFNNFNHLLLSVPPWGAEPDGWWAVGGVDEGALPVPPVDPRGYQGVTKPREQGDYIPFFKKLFNPNNRVPVPPVDPRGDQGVTKPREQGDYSTYSLS